MTAAPRRRFLRGVAACTALPAAPQVLALSPMPPVAKPVPMIAPPLRIVVPAAQVPVRLEEVSVHTRVAGRLAQTSVELTFVNPNLQVLEGELQFPLADGQQITGMAMDFAGVMREAVPVGKARGQQVFEDITRTRVDPALAEKTLGNSFRLRVYPLPAQGRKTLVLRYEESLPEQGGRWLYRLPLAYERIARFRWTGTFATAHAPIVTPGAPFDVRAVRGPAGFELSADRQDVRLGGLMEVAVAAEGAPLAVPQDFDGATWFYAEPAVATRLTPRGAPSSVLIAWDASGSAGERSLTRDLALLDAYFSRFRNVDVTLRVFRDRIEAPRAFRVAGGDWQALRRPLEALDHDGASNLSVLDGLDGADEMLLFSDALATYGDPALPAPAIRTYAMAAAIKRDVDALRALAERSGGRFIDSLHWPTSQAVRELTGQRSRVVVERGDGVADVLLASPYADDGRVRLAGRLVEPRGSVVLRLDGGNAAPQRITAPVRRQADGNGRFAAQRWARLRVAALEPEWSLNRGEIERLGKRFGLITRATSLIILDTAADYARHDIEPPADLRAETERLRAHGAAMREADLRAHRERVVSEFRSKQAWWAREFPKGERPARAPAIGGGPQDRARPGAWAEGREASRLERRRDATTDAAVTAAALADAAPAPAAVDGNEAFVIRLQPWAPDSRPARRLRDADPRDLYRIYLDERDSWRHSTAFYLDVADLLFARGQPLLAQRVLSNLAEMNLENRHVLRVLGQRLLQAGDPLAALGIFSRVLELAPNEPQSHRDVGLALAATGQTQKAVDALWRVVDGPSWHGRFPEIELIALAELNALVATAVTPPDTSAIDPRLLHNLPLDLRAVLTWDADNTDIDLWVTDPNGEKAFYGNRLTWQGGRMSADFTGGYGPEEFSLRSAKPGRYRIEAQFYGHRQQIVAGATTLQVRLTTRFGTPEAKERMLTLRLRGGGEVVTVGEFEVGAG